MASAFHRCHHCGYETDLSSTMAVFEDNPYCRQCGLSAAEGDLKMQDDLINMMTRNLQLSPIHHQHHQDLSMPPTPQVVPEPAPITYITQHYHHSNHQASTHDLPVSTILEHVGVNPSVLLPSQVALFKNAGPEQRQRLIELWQISPPTSGSQLHPDHVRNWPETSMAREEEAAQYRLHLKEQERLKNLSALSHAEPYIVQGYDNLATSDSGSAEHREGIEYKQSSDPAYKSREWWQFSDDEPMEHQYGMLQAYAYQVDYTAAAAALRKTHDGDAEMS